MSNINQNTISKNEGRKLAKWKPLITTNGEINYNFGKDFDKWFNDRYYLRNVIIENQASLMYHLQKNRHIGTEATIIKRNGYIFPNAYKIDKLTKSEIELYAENLNKFNNYCKKNNIKLYIVIPPCSTSFLLDKNIIYQPKTDRTVDLVNYAKEKYNLDIIFPEEILRNIQKNEMVYYKIDHHLTDYGSYILYENLLNTIKKDFPKLTKTSLKDFSSTMNNKIRAGSDRKYGRGLEYRVLGVYDDKLCQDKYKYYDYKYLDNITITKLEGPANYLHQNPKGNYKLIIIGDSMQETLTYYLNTSFKEIYKYRTNPGLNYPKRKSEFDMNAWSKIIEKHKPDAILLIKHSGTYDFSKMYPQEENK
ncbi:MAG: hypothetical protein E7Z87_08785 [Cyanobacteria bacterium SIG26]|nr:hypothetical protein [Cyanobacteria bacterium SIG26]